MFSVSAECHKHIIRATVFMQPMRTFTEDQLNQLLTPTEAAAIKGWPLNTFKYRVAKPDAPRAIPVGGGEVRYDATEIRDWNPVTQSKGRKTCKTKQPTR